MDKKIEKKLKDQVDHWIRDCFFLASIPFIALWIFLFFNIFWRVVPFWELFTEHWMVLVGAFWFSLFFFLIWLREHIKRKWIYNSIIDGTIVVKKTEIIKFVPRVKNLFSKEHRNSDFSLYFITSDWEKKYKSGRYSDKEIQLLWDKLDINLYFIQDCKIWFKLRWKKFSIWDKIDVYVDPKHKRNYIMDID